MTKPTHRRVFLQKSFPMGTGLLVLRDSRLAFGSQKWQNAPENAPARLQEGCNLGGRRSKLTTFQIPIS